MSQRSALLCSSAVKTGWPTLEWVLAVEADYVHPCWEGASPTPHKLINPDIIARIHRHGLGIVLWHEERPDELRQLVKLDVDGICTDKPDLLASILEEVSVAGDRSPGD